MTLVGNAKPCNLRCCVYCARVASKTRFHKLKAGTEKATSDPRPGFAFKFITLTLKRNPRSAEPHTIDALRATIIGLARSASFLWKAGLRQPGAGLYRSIECSGSGHVHLHMVYYGPFLNQEWLIQVFKEAYGPYEEASFRSVDPNYKQHIRKAEAASDKLMREVTKYATKAPSSMSERWLRGCAHETMNTELVARFELAAENTHLTQMYGAFRGAKVEEGDADDGPDDDGEQACDDCGVVGQWVNAVFPVSVAVRMMHARGLPALKGSQWSPPTWQEGDVDPPEDFGGPDPWGGDQSVGDA